MRSKCLTHDKNFIIEHNSRAAVLGVLHGGQLSPLVCVWVVLQKAVTETIRIVIHTEILLL